MLRSGSGRAGGPARIGARRWLLGALFAALCALATAPLEAQDAGTVTVRAHVERAPDGSLRRGRLDVPGWVVVLGGGAIAALAAGALAYRLRRNRR